MEIKTVTVKDPTTSVYIRLFEIRRRAKRMLHANPNGDVARKQYEEICRLIKEIQQIV